MRSSMLRYLLFFLFLYHPPPYPFPSLFSLHLLSLSLSLFLSPSQMAALAHLVLPDLQPPATTTTQQLQPTPSKKNNISSSSFPSPVISSSVLQFNYERKRHLTLVLAIPLTLIIFNNADHINHQGIFFIAFDPNLKEESLNDGSITLVYSPLTDTIHYLQMESQRTLLPPFQ